jgi:hypothetical protein
MHIYTMSEFDGTFGKPVNADRLCRKCGSDNVSMCCWESNCGGYEDYKYNCAMCGHVWWVEGPDS